MIGLPVDSGERPGGTEPERIGAGIEPIPMVSAPAGLSVTAWGALQPLLSALPGPQCVAVMLRFCEALPQSVIAARMDVSPAQVERLLETALARLREQL